MGSSMSNDSYRSTPAFMQASTPKAGTEDDFKRYADANNKTRPMDVIGMAPRLDFTALARQVDDRISRLEDARRREQGLLAEVEDFLEGLLKPDVNQLSADSYGQACRLLTLLKLRSGR